MPYAPHHAESAAPVETWLLEGLAAASRMLRDESDELACLALAVGGLVDLVSWESPSARAFRWKADGATAAAQTLSSDLDLLRLSADGIRFRLVSARAA